MDNHRVNIKESKHISLIMEPYNKRNARFAGLITTICVVAGAIAWWLSRSHIFIDIIAIPVGLTAIVFSHDLTMQAKDKYKQFNYKVHRGIYIAIGSAFILFGIVGLFIH